LILLVTTPADAAVLDAYATLKRIAIERTQLPIRLLVNQAEHDAAATSAQQRLDKACQKFISRSIPALPALPRQVADEFGRLVAPRAWENADTPFGHATLWLGRAVRDLLATDFQRAHQPVHDECTPAASVTA
jgi:hypothetical protein